MPLTVGPLGQAAPAAATPTTLYTTPVDKRASVKLTVTNRSASGDSITVWLIPSGQTAANEYLVSSGEVVGGNTSFTSVVWTLAAGDFLRAESTGGNVTFMVNGIEQDG